jgi:hypothetical protein
VLSGTDRLSLGPIDRWVGGVRLNSSAPSWRWNPDVTLPSN